MEYAYDTARDVVNYIEYLTNTVRLQISLCRLGAPFARKFERLRRRYGLGAGKRPLPPSDPPGMSGSRDAFKDGQQRGR